MSSSHHQGIAEEANTSPPDVTLAIEGWNAQDLDSREVFERSLSSLIAQSHSIAQHQILVLLDGDLSEDDSQWIIQALPSASLIQVDAPTYYRFKNTALELAKGEFIVFADSDVRYSPKWLENMLRCLRSGHDLVVGNTQYDDGFLRSTLNLVDWAATQPQSGPTDWFYGNNLGLSRSIVEKLHFRDDLGSSGGGAVNILREQLAAIGKIPWFCAEAEGWHHLPPFLAKRLRVGGYHIHYRRKAPESEWSWVGRVPILAPFLATGGTLVKSYLRAWRLRSTLPLRGWSLPLFWLTIMGVKLVELVGAAMVAWAPGWVDRRFDWFNIPAVQTDPSTEQIL